MAEELSGPQGPLIPLVYDLMAIVAGIDNQGGPLEMWDLWTPTMRIVHLRKVEALLNRLMAGQESTKGQIGCDFSLTMTEQAAYDAKNEIERLFNIASRRAHAGMIDRKIEERGDD